MCVCVCFVRARTIAICDAAFYFVRDIGRGVLLYDGK